MKIWYGSDLHCDCWYIGMDIFHHIPNWNDYDLFIFAGDITEWCVGFGEKNLAYTLVIGPLLEKGKEIIYVPGNHEFYGGDYDEINDDMADFFKNIPGITFLQYGMLHSIPGVADFIGGTMWTDVFKGNILAGKFMQSRMNDRKCITRGYKHFSYKDLISQCKIMQSNIVTWFEKKKLQGNDVPVIVISHHAPSYKSLDPAYCGGNSLDRRDRYINSGYASDLEHLMFNHKIDYWIHGHIHLVWNYKVGNTNVLANPLGYLGVKWETPNDNLGAVMLEIGKKND